MSFVVRAGPIEVAILVGRVINRYRVDYYL